MTARQVVQKQDSICASNLGPSALNANLLYLINAFAFAQACGINDVNRHAFNLNGLLHHIARGACNGGDDGQLGTRQGIEQ